MSYTYNFEKRFDKWEGFPTDEIEIEESEIPADDSDLSIEELAELEMEFDENSEFDENW